MDLLVTLIIGGLVGWLASVLMKTDGQMGIMANIVVGIVGSFLGIAVANVLGIRHSGTSMHWIVVFAGAVLFIAILQALGVLRRVAAWR